MRRGVRTLSIHPRAIANELRYARVARRRKRLAPSSVYLDLHQRYREVQHPEMEKLERQLGFHIDPEVLDEFALHLQVVVKESALNWQHGRLLYAVLRRYVDDSSRTVRRNLRILETGTARGFSAMCMSRALGDSGAAGCILSVDRLSHNIPILWNCIDDCDGPQSRESLLARWPADRDRCLFLSGKSRVVLSSLGASRIHFAFLDAEHTKNAVLDEFDFVKARQEVGDIVVFDDVTPRKFPEIVDAVSAIEMEGQYAVQRIQVSQERGYAIARRRAE